MASHLEKLLTELQGLTDEEKLRVLDAILTDLNNPNRDVDCLWLLEARKRWTNYKAGRLRTVSYAELMSKYRR